MSKLEELGKSLLDKSKGALFSSGGGILRWDKRYNLENGKISDDCYYIQCSVDIDNTAHKTLEEATLHWLQLKFEGKI